MNDFFIGSIIPDEEIEIGKIEADCKKEKIPQIQVVVSREEPENEEVLIWYDISDLPPEIEIRLNEELEIKYDKNELDLDFELEGNDLIINNNEDMNFNIINNNLEVEYGN